MVAGHLREKGGYYYAVLNYTDVSGKRKTKWDLDQAAGKGQQKEGRSDLDGGPAGV